ncbi:nitroreductase [Chthoniobacter flavus Ellin428]|uniref:Nitroreductase n=1 Tax=Chthoniobacter flavus Ellin428 TaxID=497964 RepID=B4CYI2_9BACT|nr:NAD(P)H-dependent oxidoreductase [Chthoniobacter flavus]EDY20523.1 nitroreductase [Chthoniobacter flavus Ellin428]TCO89962.1 nitroreductase [Chthoniobacter flavus]
MQNPPVSNDTLLQQLRWRYATKSFDQAKKIADADWATLEQALILTPTSYGFQPYRFVVITDPATRQKLLPISWGQCQVADASHFVVFAAKTNVTEADVDYYLAHVSKVRGTPVEKLAGFRKALAGDIVHGPRSKAQHEWATRQCYIALGNLMTSAAMLGIDVCPMEGIDAPKYDELLGLPAKGYNAVVAAAVGYRSDADKYAAAPKVRYPAEELFIRI